MLALHISSYLQYNLWALFRCISNTSSFVDSHATINTIDQTHAAVNVIWVRRHHSLHMHSQPRQRGFCCWKLQYIPSFADDFVLLASSQQVFYNLHALDRFSTTRYQERIKISTKKTEALCLSRNPRQCMLRAAIHCSRWRSSSTWSDIHNRWKG